MAKLSHPNVVQVHFIGREGDLLYIGMPCIEGGTLADRLKQGGALPVGDAIRVITEVTGAIAHAHRKGIIHRDIKTQNVLIDAEGDRCLVTDFGIARTEDASSLTATGLVIGTPAYLSPEQISGERGDHRVDIYAIGVLAYETVTGRLPFEGANATAVMMKRFEGPPAPPSSIRADVPHFLDQVIGKCLALDAADRYQSADDILTALQAGLHGEPEFVRTTGTKVRASTQWSRGRRALLWSATAIVVAVLIAIPVRSALIGSRVASMAAADSSLVLIPAGQYTIGSNTGPADARPAHPVSLSAFRMGVREVTIGEYASAALTAGRSSPVQFRPQDSALPVTGISWSDASNYCASRYKNGRLPTEEEWEATARGRAGRSTPWDNAAPGLHANLASAGRARPAAVGSFAFGATPEGVFDLLGNVWEWTSSPYRAYPGGSVNATPPGTYYVIRGGAFDTPSDVATPWYRVYAKATASAEDLSRTGFRCAVSIGAGN